MAKNFYKTGSKRILYGLVVMILVVVVIFFFSFRSEGFETTTIPYNKKPFFDPYLNTVVADHNLVVPIYAVDLYQKKIDPATFTTNDVIANIHFFSTEVAGELLPSCFTSPPGGIFAYFQFTSEDLKWDTFGMTDNYNKKSPVNNLKMFFLDRDCSIDNNGILTDFTNIKIPSLFYYNRTTKMFIFEMNDKTRKRYILNGHEKPLPFKPKCACVEKPSTHSYYFLKEEVYGKGV